MPAPTMKKLAIAVAALCLLAAAQRPACADKAGAERLFRVGKSAYEAGRFLEAAGAMEAAYREWSSPGIAFSAAQAYRLHYFETRVTRSLFRAAELYRIYLKEVSSGGRRADAALNLAELEPILRTLQPEKAEEKKVEVTRIGISASKAGAEVSIAGGMFNAAPVFAVVEPGKHAFRVRAPGYFSKDGELQVFEGQFAVAEVKLDPIPARVRVEVEVGAKVYVEGLVVERPQAILLKPGKHRLDITKRGRGLVTIEREFERDTAVTLQPRLVWTSRRKISIGLLGASALMYGVAIGTGLATVDAYLDARDLDDLRKSRGLSVAERKSYNAHLDDRDFRRTLTFALAGTATALAAAGALVFFFDNPEVSRPIAPTVSPAGIGVRGRF